MIPRYTRPEMGRIWEPTNRFECLLQVEMAVAKAQAANDIIPKKAYADIRKKAKFHVKRIDEIEKTTRHDVIAFVSNVAENVGDSGRYVHYGMTSSDVLDTALSLQIREAWCVLKPGIEALTKKLDEMILKHSGTICAGRTHGMHAEATTLGYKLAGHKAEFERDLTRIERAVDQMMIVKLSGAVGTYSTQPPEVENAVAKELKLVPETIATQVIPRDRHAELIWSLAMLGSGLERLAVELRHLQRTEVGEAIEGFGKGQKGSSAMPHKKNPISAENLTGLARLLRSHAAAALENIVLWHERDISHSSVERVVFPDAFILADYATHRMTDLLKALVVQKDRMQKNMELSQGQLYSSQVLLKMIDRGLTREEAYRIVQRVCHDLEPSDTLEDRLLADPEARQYCNSRELRSVFSGKSLKERISRLLSSRLRGKGKHAAKRR